MPNTMKLSRRSALAMSIAAAAGSALAASTSALGAADPIFAAIEAHEAAFAALMEPMTIFNAIEGNYPDGASMMCVPPINASDEEVASVERGEKYRTESGFERAEEAWHHALNENCRMVDSLLEVEPTTLPGLLALFEHLADVTERDPDELPEEWGNTVLATTVASIRKLVSPAA